MATVALALAAALAATALQAAHAQGGGEVADRLGELSSHVERANEVNMKLYLASLVIGAGLAGIAIWTTRSNTKSLRRQTENYEERTRLLREDIDDRLTPLLAWTLAGEGKQMQALGKKLITVRIVNAGQAPAMRVTSDVRHMLSADGAEFSEAGRRQHSWGALLPNESVELVVWVSYERLNAVGLGMWKYDGHLKATESGRGEFRADVELHYQSMDRTGHTRKINVRYDGKDVHVRDVEDDAWRPRG